MKQILLIWCLSLVLGFVNFVICSRCVKYPDILKQQTCLHDVLNSNTNCDWTEKTVSYEVKQRRDGIVNVKMPMLATCNSSSYIVSLCVNEKVTSADKCDQDFVVWAKQRHTEIQFESYSHCSQDKKSNVPVIEFNNVFTGCYKIEVRNAYNDRLYNSDPFFISTDYKKQLLTGKDTITMKLPYIKDEMHHIEITVHLNESFKPPSIEISLSEKSDENKTLQGQVQTEYIDKKSKTFKEIFEVCQSFPNITFNCYSKKDYYNHIVYICQYKGLHSGEYEIKYRVLDEYTRCNKNTLWAKPGVSCNRNIFFNLPKINPITSKQNVYQQPTSLQTEIYIIIAIIIILTVFIICTVIYVYRRVPKSRNIQNTPTSQYHLLNRTMPRDVSRKVLLVYVSESELFCEIISSFKNLLGHVKNISRIFDINVCNEEINIDPQDGILSEISSPETIVILFLNFRSLTMKYSNMTYEDENCQNRFFPFAIKQLQISTNRDDENFFVVQLNNFPRDDLVFSSLPTEKRYIMPEEINLLLSRLDGYNEELYRNTIDTFRANCRTYERKYQDIFQYINSVL